MDVREHPGTDKNIVYLGVLWNLWTARKNVKYVKNFVLCFLTCCVVCDVVHLIYAVFPVVTMLSTAVTVSNMDQSSQDQEDTEASTSVNTLQDMESPRCQDGQASSCWPLLRPIMAIVVGTLLFGSGTTLSLFYFTNMGNVPYMLGPILLSLGLMFLVTGLVWIPVLKQSQEENAHTQVNQGKGLQEEHKHN